MRALPQDEVFRTVWQSGEIPNEWKKGCTVLIHKKVEQSDPANFRPITLESTPLKIFTPCLRDFMFAFLSANGYIENRIQKGFMPKLSGTYEHTAQMSQLINKAIIKQRSVVITLLDLINAFGEVHHNLIAAVLKYRNIITFLIKYKGSSIVFIQISTLPLSPSISQLLLLRLVVAFYRVIP